MDTSGKFLPHFIIGKCSAVDGDRMQLTQPRSVFRDFVCQCQSITVVPVVEIAADLLVNDRLTIEVGAIKATVLAECRRSWRNVTGDRTIACRSATTTSARIGQEIDGLNFPGRLVVKRFAGFGTTNAV